MLTAVQQKIITGLLATRVGHEHKIISSSPVSGGSINETYKVQTDRGRFFVKINRAGDYPGMFASEAKGLELLRTTGEIYIPGTIGAAEENGEAVFVSEFTERGKRSKHFFYMFGQSLARLHSHPGASFGLDHDNYIGSLKQHNSYCRSWPEFFSEMRLEVQLKMAYDKGYFSFSTSRSFEKLYKRLAEIFPAEPPSLLHGDLWSGNYMTAPGGQPCVFDPAVYYGHREMDIAMSRLFGGFDKDFYEGYNAQFPLEKDWVQRTDICNLYPLLVHVNLFGGGYVSDVNAIMSRFK